MKLKTLRPSFIETDEVEVPEVDADLETLIDFALSFNGYEYAGGLVELAGDENSLWDRTVNKLNAGKGDEVSIDDLRACLFWVQRGQRYDAINSSIQLDAEEYRPFVREIRKKLSI